jgi:hypothetical protein
MEDLIIKKRFRENGRHLNQRRERRRLTVKGGALTTGVRYLPAFRFYFIRLHGKAEPVIKYGACRGIGEYLVFHHMVISLVFRDFFSGLIKDHDHIILQPDDGFDHFILL